MKTLYVMMPCLALVTSCVMGPDYNHEAMNVPKSFRDVPPISKSIADLPWYDVIKDDGLQQLLVDAYRNNPDINSMRVNVDNARHYVTKASSTLFPWLGYGANTSKGANSMAGSSISAMGGSTANPASSSFTAAWELDIWGKTRRSTEAAEADFAASQEEYRALLLSMMKQISVGYLELVQLDEQLKVSQMAVSSYRESLTIFSDKFHGGMGDELQVSSASAALAASESEIDDIRSQIDALENTLSALAGRMPGAVKRADSILKFTRADYIPAGIPANVLANRPDIRQKEQELRAANARIGVAIASYFPDISLTSAGGIASADLRHSTSGNKSGWGIGADLSGPLFQGGNLKADEAIARNNFLLARSAYEKSVLSAMSDISSVLSKHRHFKSVLLSQEKSVEAYRKSVDLAMERYRGGMASYYEVLTAQQNLFPALGKLATYRYQYAACLPVIYTELGGNRNIK